MFICVPSKETMSLQFFVYFKDITYSYFMCKCLCIHTTCDCLKRMKESFGFSGMEFTSPGKAASTFNLASFAHIKPGFKKLLSCISF